MPWSRERLAAIPASEERVVLATGRYIGEGFDDPRLDTLLLALPVAWKGTVAQYAGRLHRRHAGKTGVRIHDYRDGTIAVLARMLEKRIRAYRAAGYELTELPGVWRPRIAGAGGEGLLGHPCPLGPAIEPVVEYDEQAVADPEAAR